MKMRNLCIIFYVNLINQILIRNIFLFHMKIWSFYVKIKTNSSNKVLCEEKEKFRIYIGDFFSYFIQSRVFYPKLTLRWLIQTDLDSWFIVRSLLGPTVLVRLLSQCWIIGGHTIHSPIEALRLSTVIEPTPFQKSAF